MDMNEAAKSVETLRRELLIEGTDEPSPFAEEHFLLALAALDSAAAHLRLAQYHNAAALARHHQR